jgi:trimeric autotransporter adhesin
VRHLKRHLSVANVLSCTALFVALSGAAYAVSPLGNKSVKTRNLANGAVTTLKLRGGAVTPLKLRNGAVTGAKIAPGAVGSTQLADGGVRSADLGGGVVTEGKIKNGAVTESKLAANAVSAGKLQAGAVTSAKLSSSLFAQLVKNVSYATATSASNNTEATKTITAECPTGKQAIGGGAKVDGGGTDLIAITESAPTAPNAESKRTGWMAVARAETGGGVTNWSVEAYAVCAEL